MTGAEHDRIDLSLLDVVMPDFSGPEVYARIQEIRPGLQAIFATGYTDANRSTHKIPDAMIVLSKPFKIDDVLAHVRALLNRTP